MSATVAHIRPPAAAAVIAGAATALPDGRWLAAVHGPHPVDRARLLAWIDAGCPDPAPVRQGFTVLVGDRHRLIVATGARKESCAYYVSSRFGLVVSTDLPALLAHLDPMPPVQPETLLSTEPSDTPFAGVRRLPTGHVLRWTGGVGSVAPWFDPRETFEGTAARAAARMRDTIADAVRESLPLSGDVTACLSGGLDSTMVAATAAKAVRRTGGTVWAASHAPIASPWPPSRRWEASDEGHARAMAVVPGLHVTVRRNLARTSPLSVMARWHRSSALPVMNPANLVWLDDIATWAAERGAAVLLQGNAGNATFSRDQDSAVLQALQQHRWTGLVRWGAAAGRRQGARAVAGRVRRSLAATLLPHRPLDRLPPGLPLLPDAVGHLRDQQSRSFPAGADMAELWREFTRSDPPFEAALQGRPPGLWWSDPLSDPEVVRLALSLPPEHWLLGGRDRGLARAAARGVVPESIRVRTTRGMQAADVGLWLAQDQVGLATALDRIEGSATARSFVAVDALREMTRPEVFADPWRAIAWQHGAGRVLGAGLFAAQWDDERTRSLRCDNQSSDPGEPFAVRAAHRPPRPARP